VSSAKQFPIRFLAKSYLAFLFAPELPVADWLAKLDAWLVRSPDFFMGRPIVLDLSAVTLESPEIAHLVMKLAERNIRVVGLEGANPSALGPQLPPLIRNGRPIKEPELLRGLDSDKPSAAPPQQQPGSLLLESPIRSGQSVVFHEGDVTVLGSVGSGAEIVASGSIHVYGTLRGRAMAGAGGNPRARIFCNKIEAELLAIDGYYTTADRIDESLRGRPVQAWLNGSSMEITALN
jgi:septum site-determining protein MinC